MHLASYALLARNTGGLAAERASELEAWEAKACATEPKVY